MQYAGLCPVMQTVSWSRYRLRRVLHTRGRVCALCIDPDVRRRFSPLTWTTVIQLATGRRRRRIMSVAVASHCSILSAAAAATLHVIDDAIYWYPSRPAAGRAGNLITACSGLMPVSAGGPRWCPIGRWRIVCAVVGLRALKMRQWKMQER